MLTNDINRMLTELKLAQAQASGGNKLTNESGEQSQFATALADAVSKVNDLQKDAGEITKSFEMDVPGVELPDVMIAIQKSRIAFQAMTEVRNKIITAYQDIMNMPI